MLKEKVQVMQPQLFLKFSKILKDSRLGHAYLFSGNFGSFEMVLFLAQSRFCETPIDNIPCGKCRACRLILENEFSDVSIIEPIGNLIKTDTIRNILSNFSQSGFESSQQVLIIREVEKLHPNAANSLLKFIEEPQGDLTIFLITSEENRVLPTIKSRTQIFKFPVNQSYLVNLLSKEGILLTQAKLIAGISHDQEEALSLAQSSVFLEIIGAVQKLVKLWLTKPDKAYLQISKIATLTQEKRQQSQIFELLTLLLSKEMTQRRVLKYLDQILIAKKMWQANVSLQNSLEYMILT